MKKFYFLILPLIFCLSCSPKTIKKAYLTKAEIKKDKTAINARSGKSDPCHDKLNYIPHPDFLDQYSLRRLRVNFQVMNSKNKRNNLDGAKAVAFSKAMMKEIQKGYSDNRKMWLPLGNNTPVLPPLIDFRLTPSTNDPSDDGIYFNYDDDLSYFVGYGRNKNNYNKDVIKKYESRPGEVLNIFFIQHHPDSIKSKTYKAKRLGIALGTSVKVAGVFTEKANSWEYRGLTNHEIGHVLGLAHSWTGGDGCDDTPKHPNKCWSKSDTPPCNEASNNMMDYNSVQNALSPCQIGKMRYLMAKLDSKQRKLLIPTWCEFKPEKHIVIKEDLIWSCMKDVESHITIKKGASLQIQCRLSLPKGAKIIVEPGAKLILDDCRLHNDCGDKWSGIEVQRSGDLVGEVVYIGDPVIEDVEHPVD